MNYNGTGFDGMSPAKIREACEDMVSSAGKFEGEQDYSPWEGCKVDAWPSHTVLRGKVVVENGKFFGDLKDGKYQFRKISDEIRSGAAL